MRNDLSCKSMFGRHDMRDDDRWQINILLTRDCRHDMSRRKILFSKKCHASKNSSIFCFDIHAPFTRLDAVFRRIETIARFTASSYPDRNAIRCLKRCPFIERPPLPMMIDGRLECDGCKHLRKTIDRVLNSHSIIWSFPNRIPRTFFIGEDVFVLMFFNLVIDPSEL